MVSASMRRRYEPWNRWPRGSHQTVIPLHWRDAVPALGDLDRTVLPFGRGRSYGDSCLNDGGCLLDTQGLSRFISFDRENGVFRCEAGVTLGEILTVAVPLGWFLAVTPGTQHVSVGGAIAHDVHGRNHHVAGTFGCHVPRLQLLRSSGERVICSPEQNADLYRATIGGMGLTGLILWAELQLRSIANPFLRVREEPFGSLDEFWDVSAAADARWSYTAAWVDGLAPARRLGCGVLLAGDHDETKTDGRPVERRMLPPVPVDAPDWMLNRWSVKLFNAVYRRRHARRREGRAHYGPFFYPLDKLPQWNRLYGKRGFFQYQCLVPTDAARDAIREVLSRLREAGQPPFLVVLKRFGERKSPGLMSFPRSGITLAADLPNRGQATLRLLNELDRVVVGAAGAVYPAKDARMSPDTFRASFPQWDAFAAFVDPRFSSTFWRRVCGAAGGPI